MRAFQYLRTETREIIAMSQDIHHYHNHALAPIVFASLIANSLTFLPKIVTVESDLEAVVAPDDFLTVVETSEHSYSLQ